MSKRAIVVTKFVCEYGDRSFNWAADELLNLLTENDTVNIYTSDEYQNYCDWKINASNNGKDLKKVIAKLKKLPPNAINKRFKRHEYAADFTNECAPGYRTEEPLHGIAALQPYSEQEILRNSNHKQ